MTLKNACESNRKYDIFSNYQLVSYFGIFASTFTERMSVQSKVWRL